MIRVELPLLRRDRAWRDAARRLASHGIAPAEIEWGGDSLFPAAALPESDGPRAVTAPKKFIRLCRSVLCHSDPEAPALLYTALLRHQSARGALANPADPLTRRLAQLSKSVGRDVHKMHAFVRFRELPAVSERRRFAAWFEPDHAIIEAAAPFFAKRFADMDWMIATPQGIARFEAGKLDFAAPQAAPDLPEDASEALWATYFANTFNPARVKIRAMKSEMPLKYWKNLPETRAIPEMLHAAEARVAKMRAALPTQAPQRAKKILARQLGEPDTRALPKG